MFFLFLRDSEQAVLTDPFEPRRHFVLAVTADMCLNDDDRYERGQCDKNHVHTEISTWQTQHKQRIIIKKN